MKRLWRVSPNLTFVLLCAVISVNCRSELRRHPDRYLIPEGYVGWVRIEYEVSDAPPLPLDNGFYVCNIPPNGVLKTSSSAEEGSAKDEFLYVAGDHAYPLSSTVSEGGGLIWGGGYGKSVNSKGEITERYGEFFVGPEAEYEKALLQRKNKQ
jgi:hypothetical protein